MDNIIVTAYPDHFIVSFTDEDGHVFESDGDDLSSAIHGLAEELYEYGY